MSWAFVSDTMFKEIRDFMRAEHELDERLEAEHAQKDREYDAELRKKSVAAEDEYEKGLEEDRQLRGRTLEEIRRGLKQEYEEDAIKKAIEENADQLAHWPHPKGTRYTLAQHLESNHYAADFIPGVG